jgi:hypothetical protein
MRLLNEKPAPWVEEPHTRLGVTEVAGDPSANIGPQNDNHQVQFALDFALDKERQSRIIFSAACSALR